MRGETGETFAPMCRQVLHRGESAHGGHYVSKCLDWHKGTWFQFDDDTVTTQPTPESGAEPAADDDKKKKKKKPTKSQESYMLAYVRREYMAEWKKKHKMSSRPGAVVRSRAARRASRA